MTPIRIVSTAFATLALAAVLAPSIAAAGPDGKIVRCRVETGGETVVNGPCRFIADKDGSFGLANANDAKPLFGEISDVEVSLVGKDAADVRGLTLAGINSRWGDARRSTKDRACWDGADFRICAW